MTWKQSKNKKAVVFSTQANLASFNELLCQYCSRDQVNSFKQISCIWFPSECENKYIRTCFAPSLLASPSVPAVSKSPRIKPVNIASFCICKASLHHC